MQIADSIFVLRYLLKDIADQFASARRVLEVNIVDRMQAPSDRYLLGTDQLGRDLLSRLIFGAQIFLGYQNDLYSLPIQRMMRRVT